MAVSTAQMLLKERIRSLLGMKKMTASDLGETDNEKKVYQRQVLGDSLVTFDTIHKLLYEFHDIDANWLVLGEGIMQKTVDHPRIYNNNHTEVHDQGIGTVNMSDATIPYPVQALLDEKDKRITELEKDKEQLQGLLSILTAHAQSHAPKPKK